MAVSKWKSSFSETIVSSSKFMAYILAREINGAIQKAGIIEKIGMKIAGGHSGKKNGSIHCSCCCSGVRKQGDQH